MHLAKWKILSQFSIIHSWRDLKQPTVTAEGKWKNVVPWHFLNKHKSSSSPAIRLFGGNINTGLFLTHYNPESNPAFIYCFNFSCNLPEWRRSWGRSRHGAELEPYSNNIRAKVFISSILVERSYIISTFFATLLSLLRRPSLWGEKYHFFSCSFSLEKERGYSGRMWLTCLSFVWAGRRKFFSRHGSIYAESSGMAYLSGNPLHLRKSSANKVHLLPLNRLLTNQHITRQQKSYFYSSGDKVSPTSVALPVKRFIWFCLKSFCHHQIAL